MNIKELQNLTVKKLQSKATELGISEYIGLKKQELIKLILDTSKKRRDIIRNWCIRSFTRWIWILRFSNYSYLPGHDDIYVSHYQIKRFRLKTGHLISGQIRPPKDKEKFFALLRVESINGIQPDNARGLVVFDNLTPLYPEELIKLETDIKSKSTRIIDMLSPIGKGQRGLIVAQPKTGKTILLQKIANAISENNPK